MNTNMNYPVNNGQKNCDWLRKMKESLLLVVRRVVYVLFKISENTSSRDQIDRLKEIVDDQKLKLDEQKLKIDHLENELKNLEKGNIPLQVVAFLQDLENILGGIQVIDEKSIETLRFYLLSVLSAYGYEFCDFNEKTIHLFTCDRQECNKIPKIERKAIIRNGELVSEGFVHISNDYGLDN